MQTRSLVLLGLALATSGCQSYFPHGYGSNTYPQFAPGTYGTPSTVAPAAGPPAATIQPGTGRMPPNGSNTLNSNAGSMRRQGSPAGNSVPNYRDPGTPPASLGAPAAEDDDLDTIRSKGNTQNDTPRRLHGEDEEYEQSLSSIEDEQFMKPAPYREVAATTDDIEQPTAAPKFRHSPYKKDSKGYSWLRGIVSRGPENDVWRITYSRDPLDDDRYNGSLTLVDDTLLDTLEDGDVVFVRGKIDQTLPDRYGKPSYRVTEVTPLQEKLN